MQVSDCISCGSLILSFNDSVSFILILTVPETSRGTLKHICHRGYLYRTIHCFVISQKGLGSIFDESSQTA